MINKSINKINDSEIEIISSPDKSGQFIIKFIKTGKLIIFLYIIAFVIIILQGLGFQSISLLIAIILVIIFITNLNKKEVMESKILINTEKKIITYLNGKIAHYPEDSDIWINENEKDSESTNYFWNVTIGNKQRHVYISGLKSNKKVDKVIHHFAEELSTSLNLELIFNDRKDDIKNPWEVEKTEIEKPDKLFNPFDYTNGFSGINVNHLDNSTKIIYQQSYTFTQKLFYLSIGVMIIINILFLMRQWLWLDLPISSILNQSLITNDYLDIYWFDILILFIGIISSIEIIQLVTSNPVITFSPQKIVVERKGFIKSHIKRYNLKLNHFIVEENTDNILIKEFPFKNQLITLKQVNSTLDGEILENYLNYYK